MTIDPNFFFDLTKPTVPTSPSPKDFPFVKISKISSSQNPISDKKVKEIDNKENKMRSQNSININEPHHSAKLICETPANPIKLTSKLAKSSDRFKITITKSNPSNVGNASANNFSTPQQNASNIYNHDEMQDIIQKLDFKEKRMKMQTSKTQRKFKIIRVPSSYPVSDMPNKFSRSPDKNFYRINSGARIFSISIEPSNKECDNKESESSNLLDDDLINF